MIIQELSRSECLSILERASIGRLACCRMNQPYVVPFSFAYRESCLYGSTTAGQKIEWMRCNPLVCVEVDEVSDLDRWQSIIVFGRYEELTDAQESHHESLRALDLLNRRAGWWKPGCASDDYRHVAESSTPIFYRVHIDQITGRKGVPSSDEVASKRDKPTMGWARAWLGRVFHAGARPMSLV